MPDHVNQAQIFLPVLVVVALTFVAFVRMGAARSAAIKAGHDPAYYRAHIGKPEPEATVAAVRHWGNLFELPTLFYAACLTAFVLDAVSGWALAFAWAFVVGRVIQSAVHMSYNNPLHRGSGFVLAVAAALGLWISIAIAVFERI
jgi:hypothetical protein